MSQPESWATDEEIEERIRKINEQGHAGALGVHGGGEGRPSPRGVGEKTTDVMDHLRERVPAGATRHFTAREIADDLGRSAGSVGTSLAHMRDQAEFGVAVDSGEHPNLWAITLREGRDGR